MKKKIFFIMSTNDPSGAEIVNFRIIAGLRNDFDFYWVCQKGLINKHLKEKNIKWIEIDKLSVKEIKRVIKENKPDILHATDYRASVTCALTNTRVPIISHLHNNSPWLSKISINSFAYLFAAIKCKKILTVSESIEKEYIFSKLVQKKIVCISNPLSKQDITNMIDEKDYEKKYDVCCTARLTAQKNPQKFIDVIEKVKQSIPSIQAVWIGKGELDEECKNIVKEKGLDNNITYAGYQENPFKLMASSKIFTLTSDWEGFGLVAFEAESLGLPCVVSNVGGLPIMVDESCGLLVNSVDGFANEIIKLIQNNDYYEKKKNAALKKSLKLDNMNDYLKKVESMYREVI